MPEDRKPQRGLQRKTPLRSKAPIKRGSALSSGKGLKQGGGLQRKTALQNKKPLDRGTSPPPPGKGLKRSGITSKTPPGRSEPSNRKPIKRTAMKSKPAVVTPEEKACRALVAERSQDLCECCGRGGGLEKAHRVARSQGGKWEASNILDLCHKCHHEEHHANPAEAYEGGWHLRSTSDPLTSPVLLWKGGKYDWALLDNEGGWKWCDTPVRS